MMEYFKTSRFYGHNIIVKRFSRFPVLLPLPVSIQHGWNFIPERVDVAINGTTWLWSDTIRQKFNSKFNDSKFRVYGSPFLYLVSDMNLDTENLHTRNGSIVFPAHSSHELQVSYDYEDYAKMLNELPDEYKPITVCMYYTDIHKNHNEIFEKYGFQVTSNGEKRYDKEFLLRFIENVKDKKYAFSNQMTTALLYCVHLGLRSFYYGPKISVKDEGNESWSEYNATYVERQSIKERQQYFKYPDLDVDAQIQFVSDELGEKYLLTKSKMRRMLVRNTLTMRYLAILWRLLLTRVGILNRNP
jgi:hypothetical protein